MKQNWTYKKLEEVCDINYGTRVVQKKDKGSKYYVYGGGGATFMVDDYNREDCLIVSRFAMSQKCTRFVKGKFFLNDSGLSVSTKIKKLSQPFLDKVILANNDTIYSFGKGMAQRNLDIPSFRNLVIPVPPLAEQQRIVSELDLLQGIIDKQQAQLKELDTLAQSIFYDMFGDPIKNERSWDVKKMGEICNSELGKMLDAKKNTGAYRDYLCTINVQWGAFDFTNVKQMRIEDEDIERYSVRKGDLLICEGGDTGRCAIWEKNETICYQNSLHRVRLFPDVMLPTTCLFIFMIMKKQGELDKYCKGQTIKHLVKNVLLSIPIPIPPMTLQQSFAEKIESIEKQKAAISQSIAETQKLFEYTMDKYFG